MGVGRYAQSTRGRDGRQTAERSQVRGFRRLRACALASCDAGKPGLPAARVRPQRERKPRSAARLSDAHPPWPRAPPGRPCPGRPGLCLSPQMRLVCSMVLWVLYFEPRPHWPAGAGPFVAYKIACNIYNVLLHMSKLNVALPGYTLFCCKLFVACYPPKKNKTKSGTLFFAMWAGLRAVLLLSLAATVRGRLRPC